MASKDRTVAKNRKAFHDYAIDERFEAGIVLKGTEVKSLRAGTAQIREAFARVEDGDVYLHGMHIPPYAQASTHVRVEPDRPRKLLLHRREIAHLAQATQQKGMTLVALRLYFAHGLAKVELGLGRGKRAFDRRRDIAKRDAEREMDRVRRRRERGE